MFRLFSLNSFLHLIVFAFSLCSFSSLFKIWHRHYAQCSHWFQCVTLILAKTTSKWHNYNHRWRAGWFHLPFFQNCDSNEITWLCLEIQKARHNLWTCMLWKGCFCHTPCSQMHIVESIISGWLNQSLVELHTRLFCLLKCQRYT